MRPEVVVEVVARLYVAAGRTAHEAEFRVWAEALEDLPDEHAEEVARAIVRDVDLTQSPPSPAAYRSARRRWLEAHRPPAIAEAPMTDEQRAANRERLSQLIAELAERQRV